MYTVGIRDHIMIAHSLKGETFGPAQKLHGCTYTVDVEFQGEQLDKDGIVIDIALATDFVHETLAQFNYKNLDELSDFTQQNSTTECVAKTIFDKIKEKLKKEKIKGINSLKITLHESLAAWASYEANC